MAKPAYKSKAKGFQFLYGFYTWYSYTNLALEDIEDITARQWEGTTGINL